MPNLMTLRKERREDNTMTERTRCTGIGMTGFFAGFMAGIGAGLLLAPQSGARTRRQLENLAKDLHEDTSHMLGDAKTSIGNVIEQSKSLVG
jgi:gas vesicle protein